MVLCKNVIKKNSAISWLGGLAIAFSYKSEEKHCPGGVSNSATDAILNHSALSIVQEWHVQLYKCWLTAAD